MPAARVQLRYSPAEILRAVEAHEAMLDGAAGGSRALLRNITAAGLDLEGRRLVEADLAGIDLEAGRLARADFTRATLDLANLRGVDARDALFTKASLRGVSVRAANFAGSRLDGADLGRAVLSSPSQGSFRLTSKRQPGDVVFEVDFSGCSIQHASLAGARLRGANFSDALLSGSDLSGADLSGAVLDNAVLTGTVVTGAQLDQAALARCLLDPDAGAISRAPVLAGRVAAAERWVDTAGAEGAPCVLDGEDLRPLGKALSGRKLAAMSAVRSCAVGVSFAGAQLQCAHFDDADLRCADFTGADLRGASFRGAKLRHALFDNADLRPLALTNGAERKVDMTGADLGIGGVLGARGS